MEKKLFLDAPPIIFDHAKTLRENPTNAEEVMWSCLKQKRLGFKFRRQHPISIYIADFYCHALKLIIEIDGKIHNNLQVNIHDIERQQFLEKEELRFLRFTNEEVETKWHS